MRSRRSGNCPSYVPWGGGGGGDRQPKKKKSCKAPGVCPEGGGGARLQVKLSYVFLTCNSNTHRERHQFSL